jgi:hypothetical protein
MDCYSQRLVSLVFSKFALEPPGVPGPVLSRRGHLGRSNTHKRVARNLRGQMALAVYHLPAQTETKRRAPRPPQR